jgi:hypothetical protein
LPRSEAQARTQIELYKYRASGWKEQRVRIAVLGATGNIGQRIVREALERGHRVTAIARDPSPLSELDDQLTTAAADATRANELTPLIAEHAAVISSVGPSRDSDPSVLVDVSRAVAAAAMTAGVRRVLVVGGAGSLSVQPGVELLSTPEFPRAWRGVALAHREALELWRRVKELDWTYVSPAAFIEPGTRTGHYRTGHNDLVVDASGQSRISMEDFALAVIDALEHRTHLHERITFAY